MAVTTFRFKLDRGGRGGGGGGGGRLIFENPFSCRPVQKSNYSQGLFFFSRERQRYFSVLGGNMQYEFCRDSFMLLSLKTYIQL